MKYDASHAELARLQKISGINEENLRLEITALTDRCLRLTNLQEAESALRKRYEDKANKYDVAEVELVKLKKEVCTNFFRTMWIFGGDEAPPITTDHCASSASS